VGALHAGGGAEELQVGAFVLKDVAALAVTE